MTRPCVRCGRSIGEATRVCGACVKWIRAAHPEQWSDNRQRSRVNWTPFCERGQVIATVNGAVIERFDDGWWSVEAHVVTFRNRVSAWLRVLAPEDFGYPNYLEAPRATTEDLAPLYRHIDGWLYELTGDRPE